MKALVCNKYNSLEHLNVVDVLKPVPKDNEVLVKVCATPVTTGDWRIQSLIVPKGFKFLVQVVYGFKKPRQPILGTQLAGTIEVIGKNVKKFKVGDDVIAESALALGGHAQYKCLKESANIVLKPKRLSFEEACALCFGGLTALDFLKYKFTVQPNDKILVHGASGSVGIAAVQLGTLFGARVTGVCSSSNLDFVKAYGAVNTIDYQTEDFTKNGEKYDVILDTVGVLSMKKCKQSLTKNGRLLQVTPGLFEQLMAPFLNLFSSKKVVTGVTSVSPQRMQELCDLVKDEKFKVVIDKQFSLENIAEAYRYVGQRHKRGDVVVKL
jgi:NADPH:quinone reductase-like Zn-dependent oxidoreductase